jgi:hypothetical protein
MDWIGHVLQASLLPAMNNTPLLVDIRRMVDIVKLTSRLNEDSDNLPPVVVAIQNAFQESWLSQQEVQLLEEFEASSTDTNDYDDHDDHDNDCQDLDSIVDDVPVDNQEAVVEEENNAQEQDGLMHFPIPSLVDDDENETNSLVVRLVALMEHVTGHWNELSDYPLEAKFKDDNLFETIGMLANNFGKDCALPPPRPPRQRRITKFHTVQKTRTVPRRTMLSELLDNDDLLEEDLSDGAFEELVSQISLPSTMEEEYSDVESYYEDEDVSSSEEEPPKYMSIQDEQADIVDLVLSWALELDILKSRLKEDVSYNDRPIEEYVHETDTSGYYEEWESESDDSLELEDYRDLIYVVTDNNLLSTATFIGSSPTDRSAFFVEPIPIMDRQSTSSTMPSKQCVESSANCKVDRTTKPLSSVAINEANKFEEEIIDGLSHREYDDHTIEMSNSSPSGSAPSPYLIAEADSETVYAREDGSKKKKTDSNIVRGSWLPSLKGKGLLEKLKDKMSKMYDEDSSEEYEREGTTRDEYGRNKTEIVTTDNQEPQDLVAKGVAPVFQEEAKEVPEEKEESEDEMCLGESANTALPPPPAHFYNQGANFEKSGQIPPPPPPPPPPLSSTKPSPPLQPPHRFIGINEQ